MAIAPTVDPQVTDTSLSSSRSSYLTPNKRNNANFSNQSNSGATDNWGRIVSAVDKERASFAQQKQQIENDLNDITANEIFFGYSNTANNVLNDYSSLSGMDAIRNNAYSEAISKLDSAEEEALSLAENPVQEALIFSKMAPTRSAVEQRMSGHSVKELAVAKESNLRGVISHFQKNAVAHAVSAELDPTSKNNGNAVMYRESSLAELKKLLELSGIKPTDTLGKVEISKHNKSIVTGVAQELIDGGYYEEAGNYLVREGGILSTNEKASFRAIAEEGMIKQHGLELAKKTYASVVKDKDTDIEPANYSFMKKTISQSNESDDLKRIAIQYLSIWEGQDQNIRNNHHSIAVSEAYDIACAQKRPYLEIPTQTTRKLTNTEKKQAKDGPLRDDVVEIAAMLFANPQLYDGSQALYLSEVSDAKVRSKKAYLNKHPEHATSVKEHKDAFKAAMGIKKPIDYKDPVQLYFLKKMHDISTAYVDAHGRQMTSDEYFKSLLMLRKDQAKQANGFIWDSNRDVHKQELHSDDYYIIYKGEDTDAYKSGDKVLNSSIPPDVKIAIERQLVAANVIPTYENIVRLYVKQLQRRADEKKGSF